MTARPEDLVRQGGAGLRRHYHEPIEFEDKEGRYGLLAEFTDEEQLLDAVRAARDAGYSRMDAFTPYPVEELPELVAPSVDIRKRRDRATLMAALKRRDMRGVADWLGRFNLVALLTLLGGITGGIVGYGLQLFSMAAWYPYLNIGGRPPNSWPYYLPITYELVILFASFTALIAMILLNGFPRPYHPVFNVPEFARATQDRFFLLIQADDPHFVPERPATARTESGLPVHTESTGGNGERPTSTWDFLESLAPGRVYDVAL
jgi:hypothetical protein